MYLLYQKRCTFYWGLSFLTVSVLASDPKPELQLFTYRCHYSVDSLRHSQCGQCVAHLSNSHRHRHKVCSDKMLEFIISCDPPGQYQCDFYVCTIAAIFENRSRPLGTYSTFFYETMAKRSLDRGVQVLYLSLCPSKSWEDFPARQCDVAVVIVTMI